MAKIKNILEKEGIAGVVILHEPGFSEHLTKVDAPFSCAEFEPGHLRFKTKGLDLTPRQKQELIRTTSNMMHHLSTVAGELSLSLLKGSKLIDKISGASHDGGDGHTSHAQQNN